MLSGAADVVAIGDKLGIGVVVGLAVGLKAGVCVKSTVGDWLTGVSCVDRVLLEPHPTTNIAMNENVMEANILWEIFKKNGKYLDVPKV